MKLLKKPIKILILILLLLTIVNINAQSEALKEGMFVRIYNLEGKKIAKGKIKSLNDLVLEINRNDKTIKIKASDIGKIKTKRSGGHNVLMGSVFGASLGIIVGVSTADPDALLGYTAGEGALAFGSLGAVGGAAIGGVVAGIKESETYVVNGSLKKLKLLFKQ